MTDYWMVRSDPSIRDDVEEGGFVAIGFGGDKIGDISGLSEQEIRERVRQRRPNARPGQISADTGSLNRFANSIRVDDWVVTGLKNRQYLVGTINSNYIYDDSNTEFPHKRAVRWNPRRLNRDNMTYSLMHSLGGISTLFRITKHAAEIANLLGNPSQGPTSSNAENVGNEDTEELTDLEFSQDIETKARERIADLILGPRQFGGHEFEELVAALLEAMGFKIVRPPQPGPDGGIDIIAAPDVFGFEQPRIIVQVKHRAGRVGLEDIQRLKGTLREGEKGLFVSTGGFAASVERQSGPDVTLLDGETLVKYFIEHYESMPSEYKAKVPLKRVYIPVPPDES